MHKRVSMQFLCDELGHKAASALGVVYKGTSAENQMYVLGVNTTGKTPIDQYSGASMTADPLGTIISRAE